MIFLRFLKNDKKMYGLRIDSATLTIYCSERLLSYRIDNIIAIATKNGLDPSLAYSKSFCEKKLLISSKMWISIEHTQTEDPIL